MDLRWRPFVLALLLISSLLMQFTECSSTRNEHFHNPFLIEALPSQSNEHARTVRKLVHEANWASVASISTDKNLEGFPMVNVISITDSDLDGESSGRIYFLLTDLDFTGRDWKVDNKVTFMFSGEQIGNCSRLNVDPMEPTCNRTIINGKVNEIPVDSLEYNFAMISFINRHPAAQKWIKKHQFYICTLDIEHIYLMDGYGGPKEISVKDYYDADLEDVNTKKSPITRIFLRYLNYRKIDFDEINNKV